MKTYLINIFRKLFKKNIPHSNKLYVVTTVFNPRRFASRYRLYKDFEVYMLRNPNVILYTVECTFGNRPGEIKSAGPKHHVIHVQTDSELWLKENLLNIGIDHLPAEAKYIATIDADITFARYDWAQETIHQLQHSQVVQMFSEVVYLTPDFETHKSSLSVMEGWRRGIKFRSYGQDVCDPTLFKKKEADERYGYGWNGAPGGAWAFTRETITNLGGLLDYSIVGGGDSYMAFSFLGVVDGLFNSQFKFGEAYMKAVLEWQDKAKEVVQGNVGHLPGIIFHHWHGKTVSRNYWNRNNILADNNFNPHTDIEKDSQGLYRLVGNKPQLRDDLKAYFSARNEDGTDID